MSLSKTLLISILLALTVATAYYTATPPLYEARASFMLPRATLERESASEASKNRWVWVRDGLELRNALKSEDALIRAITATPALTARAQSDGVENVALSLAQRLKIDYSGGDDNLYTISLRDRDGAAARGIVVALLSEAQSLAIGERKVVLENALVALTKQLATKGTDDPGRAKLADMVETLRADQAFLEAESKTRFKQISSVHDAALVWPRVPPLAIAAVIAGIFLAFLATLIRRHGIRRHAGADTVA